MCSNMQASCCTGTTAEVTTEKVWKRVREVAEHARPECVPPWCLTPASPPTPTEETSIENLVPWHSLNCYRTCMYLSEL